MLLEQPGLGRGVTCIHQGVRARPCANHFPSASCLLSVWPARPAQVWTNPVRWFFSGCNRIPLGSGFNLFIIRLWKIQQSKEGGVRVGGLPGG